MRDDFTVALHDEHSQDALHARRITHTGSKTNITLQNGSHIRYRHSPTRAMDLSCISSVVMPKAVTKHTMNLQALTYNTNHVTKRERLNRSIPY